MADDVPDKVRLAVVKRDKRCRICGRHGYHIHHIKYRSQGGPHEEWNLVLVCDPCHRLAHSDKPRFQELLLQLVQTPGMTFFELERRRNRTHVGTLGRLGRRDLQRASGPDADAAEPGEAR